MKTNSSKRKSFIEWLFSTFTAWLYSMATSGFFGKILSSYGQSNGSFKESFASSMVGGNSAFAAIVRRVRFKISEMFERSAMLHLWRKIANFLVGCKMRFYGSFSLIFAIYTILVYVVKRFALASNSADVGYLVFAVVMILASIPMIASSKSVSETLLESRIGHFLVVGVLGIPEEKLKSVNSKYGDSYNLAIICGLVLGTFTYLVPPYTVVGFAVIFISTVLVMNYPEIGVAFTALFLPFFGLIEDGNDLLEFCVILYSFSYFIKLIRGKRILHIEIYDILMLAFGAFVMLGGIITAGGEDSFYSALFLATLLVGAFVAQNLLRTNAWAKRCGFSVFLSGFFVSLSQIFFFVLERFDPTDFGLGFSFAGIKPLQFFSDEEALAGYLVIAFSIILSMLPPLRNKKFRFLYKLALITIPVSFLLTFNKSGLMGIIVSLVVYFYIVKRRTFSVFFGSFLAAIYVLYMLPQKWISSITAFLHPFVTSFWQSIPVWQGAFGAVLSSLFVGAGVGTFEVVYPSFALAGSENSVFNVSVFIKLLFELGLPGLLLFFAAVILALQKCFAYLKNPVSNASSLAVAAGICAIIGVFAQGIFFDVFRDGRIFYMFWCAIAYTLAFVRIGQDESVRKLGMIRSSSSAASVDI